MKLVGAPPGFPKHELYTGRLLGCSEKNQVPELVNRSASPWDDEPRRPSHADKRKALQRITLRREIAAALSGRPSKGDFRALTERLLNLAA